MNTTKTTEARTIVRRPDRLEITNYNIVASDAYGEEHRDYLEIIGDDDQIISALVDWLVRRHRDAQNSGVPTIAAQATLELERLANAMGLEYTVETTEA